MVQVVVLSLNLLNVFLYQEINTQKRIKAFAEDIVMFSDSKIEI